LRNSRVAQDKERRKERRGESDSESGSSSDGEAVGSGGQNSGGNEDDVVFGFVGNTGGKKAPKVHNPNLAKKGPEKMLKNKDLATMDTSTPTDETAGMNRKEREAVEAARRAEAYQKKTLAGETEEARRNMERLAIVKKRREEAAKKREAEGRKPGMSKNGLDDADDGESDDSNDKTANLLAKPVENVVAAKKKAAAAAPADNTDDGELPILKSIDIKKMNPAALKDALKARGLNIQGQKKDLIKRLTDHEAERVK